MFDILVYVFENCRQADVSHDPDRVAKKLSAAGFEDHDISAALSWLAGVVRAPQRSLAPLPAQRNAFRAFAAKASGKDEVRTLAAWANWALQNGIALDEAEKWGGKASAEIDSYRVHAIYARVLAKNGKAKEAAAAADKALARAAGPDADAPGVKDDAAKLQQEKASWK